MRIDTREVTLKKRTLAKLSPAPLGMSPPRAPPLLLLLFITRALIYLHRRDQDMEIAHGKHDRSLEPKRAAFYGRRGCNEGDTIRSIGAFLSKRFSRARGGARRVEQRVVERDQAAGKRVTPAEVHRRGATLSHERSKVADCTAQARQEISCPLIEKCLARGAD